MARMLESQLEEWLVQRWEVEHLAVPLESLWEEVLLGFVWDASLASLLALPLSVPSAPPSSVSHTLPITSLPKTYSVHESTSPTHPHLPITPIASLLIASTSYVNENASMLNTNPLSSNDAMSTNHLLSSPSLSTLTEPKYTRLFDNPVNARSDGRSNHHSLHPLPLRIISVLLK